MFRPGGWSCRTPPRRDGAAIIRDRPGEVNWPRLARGASARIGQIVDADRWPRREYQEPFDGIGQLADVPRPRIPLKDTHRLRRQRLLTQPAILVQGQEVRRQTWDVLRPLAQRRQGDAEDVEAVQEVLAE